MSKIVRYNGDVNAFASASLGTERTVFGDVTQSDLLSDQLTADFLRGWGIVGASESPTIQDFSAAMFTATQFISYLHQMGIAEWDTAQEYPTKGALTAHGGMVWRLDIQASAGDEPGTSRAWAAASGSVEPLGNKNVYYREAMVISPDPLITFPPTSGLTGDYAAGEELVLGTFAGAAGVSDVVITDNLGITWGANSIELRYDIENTSLFTQGDETIYIVDEAGVKRWLKVADIAALTSTLTVNVLAVDFDFALFAELGITSILEMGLQDVQGVFGEKSAAEVAGVAETVNFNKSITNSPAFVNAVDIVTTQCTLKVNVDGVVYTFAENTVVQMPTLTDGTDYAIYATSGGLIASDNFTMPSGYTEANSRRIGGFHYGDSFIYPYSFWDLKFRPTCDDPRGMVRTFQGFWADIYLLNNTPDLLGTSAYNATIADGASTPKIPAVWGGNGVDQYSSFTQYLATEVLAAYGKRLPFSAEFEVLAMGSVAGHVNGTNPITTQFDADSRSLIGCEQVSGHLHQWGAEKWDRGDGSSNYAWSEEDTNDEGQVYRSGSSGVGASLFGADWNSAGDAGSRASIWNNDPWDSNFDVSARGVCDHLQLL